MHAFCSAFFFSSYVRRPNYLADVNFVVLRLLSLSRSGFFSSSSRVCLPSSARKILFFTLALRLIRANKSEREKKHHERERERENA